MKPFFKIIIPLGFLFIICIILFSKSKKVNDVKDEVSWTKERPLAYFELFGLSDSCCNKRNYSFFYLKTMISKFRRPITSFLVQDKYYLQINLLDTFYSSSIKNIITQYYADEKTYFYSPYNMDNITDMEFLYKLSKPKTSKHITFTLYGDSTTMISKNDTIAYYHSNCRNFSIRYPPQTFNDIYGECQADYRGTVPLEIMFYKKRSKLYLLILCSKSANIPLQKSMLINLLNI